MRLNDGINQLNQIGEQRGKKLNEYSLYTVRDIIEYFPRNYEDRSVITPIYDCFPGALFTVRASLCAKFEVTAAKKLTIIRTKAKDATGEIELVWFNQPYLKNTLKQEKEYFFTGKVSERFGRLQMEAPDYELCGGTEPLNAGRIVPVYTSVARLSQKMIRAFVSNALQNISEELQDFLPESLKQEYGLCGRAFAVHNIHFPEDREAFFMARRRLVFEELLISQLALLNIKGKVKKETGIILEKTDYSELLALFPFSLTEAQKRVISETKADLSGGLTMNRLIQGDVGSGKTAVAMILAYIAIKSGYQATLMAPTEVLASQHFVSFSKIFGALGINTVLLSGSLRVKEKKAAYEAVENGTAEMVVGTHALIEHGVRFKRLALAITDEQHRFGVRQRALLSSKSAIHPHVLVMTATPIPRTLGLILYGDMDISIIDELPPGREKIKTYCVNSSYRQRIYKFLQDEISKGRQVYIICPMIEQQSEEADQKPKISELKSVMAHTEEVTSALPGCRVECLHGKMKNEQKQEIMERFSKGDTDVLVSTTVIEVGINVPNATVMLIENAERFGLSQLHQLRGRVGRGSEKSYCILMTDLKSKITKQRMQAMTATTDGFKISELDLELRGPGDYFGTRQHGLPEFKIANLYKDMEILQQVQAAAEALSDWYKEEPQLIERLDKEISRILGKEEKIYL